MFFFRTQPLNKFFFHPPPPYDWMVNFTIFACNWLNLQFFSFLHYLLTNLVIFFPSCRAWISGCDLRPEEYCGRETPVQNISPLSRKFCILKLQWTPVTALQISDIFVQPIDTFVSFSLRKVVEIHYFFFFSCDRSTFLVISPPKIDWQVSCYFPLPIGEFKGDSVLNLQKI